MRSEVTTAYGLHHSEYIAFLHSLRSRQLLYSSLRSSTQEGKVKLCIFTNAPKAYGCKVLETLHIREYFDDENIFGVDDVMKFGVCKPEPLAFNKVLEGVGCTEPSKAVMFEDSMKNVRAAKAVGMRTCFIVANPDLHDVGDRPDEGDENVDVVLRDIGQMREMLSCLWRAEWDF